MHAKAKAEPGYRFYALYDKISRDDILAHAYAECRSNKGAPGVDRQDFEVVETHGGRNGKLETSNNRVFGCDGARIEDAESRGRFLARVKRFI